MIKLPRDGNNVNFWLLGLRDRCIFGPPTPVVFSTILLEDGDNILAENNDVLLKE